MGATVLDVSTTRRGTLSPDDEQRLLAAKRDDHDAAQRRAVYRRVVVEMLDRSSFREIERITGLSTNTLQRWKKAAQS